MKAVEAPGHASQNRGMRQAPRYHFLQNIGDGPKPF
jgi:hypothetical protein